MAAKVGQFAIKADPYASLTHENPVVRHQTANRLIAEIKDAVNNEQKTHKKADDRLSVNLQYALERCIKGLESFEQYARVGFSTAIVLLIESFPAITPEVIESIALQRYEYSSTLAQNEIQYFDLGWCFLTQCLIRSHMITNISVNFLEKLLRSIVRLQAQHKQMGELVCETIATLLELYATSPEHFIHIKDAAHSVIPKNNDNCKPHHISVILALRRIGHESLLPEDLFNPFDTDNWQQLFTILDTALYRFPMVPSAWEHLLRDYMSLSTQQFQELWINAITPRYATTFHYNKKGLAIELAVIALQIAQTRFQQSVQKFDDEHGSDSNDKRQQHMNSARATLSTLVKTILQPPLIKLLIYHIRADDMPLRPHAAHLHDAIEQLGRNVPSVVVDLINLLSNPSSGGHRFFDAKSHTHLCRTLATFLSMSDLRTLIHSSIDTFVNAKALAYADVRLAAEAAKEYGEQKRKLTETGNTDDNTESSTPLFKDEIGDVDEFLKTPPSIEAITKQTHTLQEWVADHLLYFAELLITQQRRARAATKASDSDTKTSIELLTDEAKQLNDQCFQDALRLLYRHAFFQPNEDTVAIEQPKPATTARGRRKTVAPTPIAPIIVHAISERCLALCVARYSSLLQALSMANVYSRPEIGAFEGQWFEFIANYDIEVQKHSSAYHGKFTDDANASVQIGKDAIAALQSLIDDGQQVPRGIHFALTCSLSLVRAEPSIFAPLVPDLCEISRRVIDELQPKKSRRKATGDDDDDLLWIDVLMDVLFSFLGYGGQLIRHVVVKVFTAVCERMEMSSIHDLISTLVKSDEPEGDDEQQDGNAMGDDNDSQNNTDGGDKPKKRKAPAPDDSDDDVFQVDDDDEDEDDSNDDDESADFGAVLREAVAQRKASKSSNMDDNSDDDDEDDEDLEELTVDALSDLLLDTSASVMPEFQAKAIQGIVKIRKDRSRQHRDQQQQELNLKLRILDLIEIIITKLPRTNAWLSLFMPLAVLVTSNRNEAFKPLHTRAFGIFGSSLCKQIQPSSEPITLSTKTVEQDQFLSATDKCNGLNIQSVLNALFESAVTSKSHEGVALATDAISCLGVLYVQSPACAKEMQPFIASAGEDTTKRRSTRRKTIAAATPPTYNEEEVRQSIQQARVNWLSARFTEALDAYFSHTRHVLNHRFFEQIIRRVPYAVWADAAMNRLLDAHNGAPSVYLRCEAIEFLIEAVRNRKSIPNPTILEYLKKIYSRIYDDENMGVIQKETLKKANSGKVQSTYVKLLFAFHNQVMSIFKLVNQSGDVEPFTPEPLPPEKRAILCPPKQVPQNKKKRGKANNKKTTKKTDEETPSGGDKD